MKKKVLITGGSGFFGRNVREYFEQYYVCVAPTKEELNLLDEKSVESYLKKERFDTIIHTAIYNVRKHPEREPTHLLYNNLRMFYSLIRRSTYFDRMFYFGSGAEYNKAHLDRRVDEEYFDTYIPQDDYGFAKYIMGKQSEQLSNVYCLSVFGCFGKYEDWWSRFISQSLCRILVGEDILIHQNSLYDYLYITDLSHILRTLVDKKTLKYKRYNVCSGKAIDLYSIAQRILKVTGVTKKIIVEKAGKKEIYLGDNSRLLQEIGPISFTPIDTAIAEMYSWYQSHRELIDPKKFV